MSLLLLAGTLVVSVVLADGCERARDAGDWRQAAALARATFATLGAGLIACTAAALITPPPAF